MAFTLQPRSVAVNLRPDAPTERDDYASWQLTFDQMCVISDHVDIGLQHLGSTLSFLWRSV